jgi:hypothetical protein
MNPAQDFTAVANLDLEPIKFKLMHAETGEGWSQEHADAIEQEYRRFLYLAKKFPHEQASPLVDVDTFWHYHILDTMKYAADCEQAFGYFLHHFPQRGDSDAQAHRQSAKRTRELYEMTFGEDNARAVPEAAAHRSARKRGGRTQKAAYCRDMGTNDTAYCGFRPPTVRRAPERAALAQA